MCETINWLTPTKEVVKERVIEKDAAAEARKKKVEEKLAQKEAEKKIEEVKQKILEDLLKQAVKPAAIKFDSIKHLGQERVDEEARKEREYHEEGERRKAKAIAEEQVSANKLVNSDELKQVIEKNIGKYNVEVQLIRSRCASDHNIIRYDSSRVKMFVYADGWNAKSGVWDVQRTAQLAKAALEASGFTTKKIERYKECCYAGSDGYSFDIDLTSMFKKKD